MAAGSAVHYVCLDAPGLVVEGITALVHEVRAKEQMANEKCAVVGFPRTRLAPFAIGALLKKPIHCRARNAGFCCPITGLAISSCWQ